MKTDKLALDGYGFISRPKTGLLHAILKRPSLCQTSKTYWQTKCKMWLTSVGLCERSSTSGQQPDHLIQGLLHCASLPPAQRFALEETKHGRRGEQRESCPSLLWGPHTGGFISSTKGSPVLSQILLAILCYHLFHTTKTKNTFKERINPRVEYNSVY